MDLLDNPIWHALGGPQRAFAEARGLAVRYDRAVAPFAALPDEASAQAWDDLRSLVGPEGVAVVFRDAVAAPAGWTELFRMPTVQMVLATRLAAAPGVRVERLAARDAGDMLALVHRTQPGPFAARTIELGTYLGVRHEGALVAMAGERMRLPGHTELSAICTDPAHRGRGLASQLVRTLIAGITGRGEIPFLHALVENVTAIRLYEALGFRTRRLVEVVGLRPRA